jgi:cytochrome P450
VGALYTVLLLSIDASNRAMSRDEKDYPEPHIFNPERFLKGGQIDPSVRSPIDIAFGFGRRQVVPDFHI